MTITIAVDGVSRVYEGDYDELHSQDWDERVRDLLDTVKYHSNEPL